MNTKSLFSCLLQHSALPLLGCIMAATSHAQQLPQPLPDCPRVSLPAAANGNAAVAALGATLPAVAACHGYTTSEFARMLRADKTLWIDTRGRAYFIDPKPPEPTDSGATDVMQSAPFPLADTFALQSKPDAPRVIYLDFTGHSTSGTAWNQNFKTDPIVSPAYSLDADPAFSDQELADIQNIWRKVAEDYAPFDVNVTTSDPGQNAITRTDNSDPYFGTRVVITSDNFANCGCGGFAYVGVFSLDSDYYLPAFVFNTGVSGAGEAVSHEAGHNLGLSHDGVSGGDAYYTGHGTGDTGWAPIMGVGYYKPLVQWSKGEYSGADNAEDDLGRIVANGAPLVSDDHGDGIATASDVLVISDGAVDGITSAGLIHTGRDLDMFRILAGAGDFSIVAAPAPFSPNLDISATLFDSNANLVASSNPIGALGASINITLPAGEFFLRVEGIGEGNPQGDGYSDYGSLGRYVINGTVAAPNDLLAPQAVATAPGYSAGIAPLYVAFDGGSSVDAISWAWDFGDGASASGELSNHTYAAPGNYTATLTVSSADGLTASDSLDIVVDNQAPIAVAQADKLSGTAPVSIQFTGGNSYDQDTAGSITHYQWTFGDGASTTTANPEHTYTMGGNFTASLTVTDDFGASDVAQLDIVIDAPLSVDQFATGEITSAGTVSGSYLDTRAQDGNEQAIIEMESGGRKSSRYSYLEHSWLFDLVAGEVRTLLITGRRSASVDGDTMAFSYTLNDGAETTLPIQLGTAASSFSAILPAAGGQFRLIVRDSDRNSGNNQLDTVYIDQLVVRTDSTDTASVPAAATHLVAGTVSATAINLSWQDNATDEAGFRVERSVDGGNSWMLVASVGTDSTSFIDSGLSAATTYSYRVTAFNTAGSSEPSNVDSATTSSATEISLQANAYKEKGVQTVDLSWQGVTSAWLYRDGIFVADVEGTAWSETLGKGSGSYRYQACNSESDCSNEVTVVF
ncbi:PKD domain-containing protein [Kineobactrum sediminis]|nr:PKD domain-containing protein [Kineobactrum sediminis]